jgi:hypothetical protein
MDCYRLALNSDVTSSLRREHLNLAGKLSRTFAMLLDALNHHRGKCAQKITVEHVHVHSGGQTVVGMVETPGEGLTGMPSSMAATRRRRLSGDERFQG